MPVTSSASPFTSVTASPLESHSISDTSIELKIPLPSSSVCSDEEGDASGQSKEPFTSPSGFSMAEHEGLPAMTGQETQKSQDDVSAEPNSEYSHGACLKSLDELAQIIRSEAYQRRQTISIQSQVDQLTFRCGLDRRLISTFSIAYGNMIDQYQTEDQPGFAMIHDACEQLKASCNMSAEAISTSKLKLGFDSRPIHQKRINTPWMDRLPPDSQRCLLAFLTKLRTDPNFLAERISNLSSKDLLALTSSYHPAGIDYSVLQNHSHGRTHLYSKNTQMMSLSRRMDNLQRFHNEDPLFALLYSVFDSSAIPGSQEDRRRMDVWSATCARNFMDASAGARIGSDEFAIATMDAFVNLRQWSLKSKMEAYLLNLLADGSFLLDQSSQQSADTKESIELHHASIAIREAEFFEKALTDLFELLTTQPLQQDQQAVPESALAFVHAILRKIEDPEIRSRAERFIVCRWYFATFISSVVLHPEVRGIMMTYHVGDTARQRILQQLVLRLQQRVFDVTLQCNGLIKPEIRNGIKAIFELFGLPDPVADENRFQSTDLDEERSSRCLMLSAHDAIGLVQTLYPEGIVDSQASEFVSAAPLLDRPSTAGSSTLIAGSSDFGSAEAPSTAPSSIETPEKLADESLLTIPRTEDRISPSEGETMKVIEKATETTIQDFTLQLQLTCRTLKDLLLTNNGNFTEFSAWVLLPYLRDGSLLYTGTGSKIPASELAPQSVSHTTRRAKDGDDNREKLKSAVIDLLGEDTDRLPTHVYPLHLSGRSNDLKDPLGDLLRAAASRAQSNLDFRTAHSWWQVLEHYHLFLDSASLNTLPNLILEISADLRILIEQALEMSVKYNARYRSLIELQHRHDTTLTYLQEQRKALRIKMWYICDIRHSGVYEEALLVTRALRTMASSKRSKQTGGITNWARQRLRGSSIQDRSESQTLEALAASKEQGGLSKLADEQVEITSRWLTRKSVENFCKGEERIHRFCFEVQRSVNRLAGPSLLESPVLWSSNLFKFERSCFSASTRGGVATSPYGSTFAPPFHATCNPMHNDSFALQGIIPKGLGLSRSKTPTNNYSGFWPAGQPPRASTGVTYHPNLPPTPTSPSNAWSNNVLPPNSPLNAATPPLSSVFGFGQHSARSSQEAEPTVEKKIFAEQVKKHLCCLLLSDLGYLLWNQGSETDAWINERVADDGHNSVSGIRGASVTSRKTFPARFNSTQATSDEKAAVETGHFNERPDTSIRDTVEVSAATPNLKYTGKADLFPYVESYKALLRRFSLSYDPYAKLNALHELEDVIIAYLYDASKSQDRKATPSGNSDRRQTHPGDARFRSKSVPRTKATSLEEVIANCTERRAGTLRFQGSRNASILDTFAPAVWTDGPGTDDIVTALLSILRTDDLRPTTLFRDLQYIAAFVPSEILDQTPQGKAFWDVALAALALKDDLCDGMIIQANKITAYHISPAKQSNPLSDTDLVSTTLRDAANLWLIAAKEGSPVAARELGLFYLTHPELLPRITIPFSLARDVFRLVPSMDYSDRDKERGALDPYTFAVVRHWMEIAANGGDKEAKDFLKGSGDVDMAR